MSAPWELPEVQFKGLLNLRAQWITGHPDHFISLLQFFDLALLLGNDLPIALRRISPAPHHSVEVDRFPASRDELLAFAAGSQFLELVGYEYFSLSAPTHNVVWFHSRRKTLIPIRPFGARRFCSKVTPR